MNGRTFGTALHPSDLSLEVGLCVKLEPPDNLRHQLQHTGEGIEEPAEKGRVVKEGTLVS